MDAKIVTIPYSPQGYQLDIHNSPSRFRVVKIGRRGGKTELAVNEIIKRSVEVPGLYWIVAPSYRQVKSIIWTRLKAILRADSSWVYNENELSAVHEELGTKIELRGADNEDSLRGVGLHGAVLDECAMLKSNVWPEIIRPMLADKQGWALFISTPRGRNWFYDIFTKGGSRTNSGWESWSYPTTINRYIPVEEVEQAKKDMSERLFQQEFLAEFLNDETGVFKRIMTCVVGSYAGAKEGRFYVMGVDLAKTQDFTVLCVMDSVTRAVVAFERFQDVSWKEQKLRIQELSRRYNNALCIVDSTGVGDPIYEDLGFSGVSVEGFKFTNESKNQLIENLAIALEQRLITFPREEVLVTELQQYEYQITEKGRITYSAPDGKHDDCVIGLALATWGIRGYLKEAAIYEERISEDVGDRQGRGELINPVEPAVMGNYTGY